MYEENTFNNDVMTFLKSKLSSYRPTFWIIHPYISSIFTSIGENYYLDCYDRWEYILEDNSTISLDIYPRNHEALDISTPVVVLVPGILGNSSDPHIKSITKNIWEKFGWSVIIFNRIGYSKTKVTGRQIISFYMYEEFDQLLKEVKARFGKRPVYLMGSSMGAVFVQRYLEEHPNQKHVDASCCVSSPWNVGAV